MKLEQNEETRVASDRDGAQSPSRRKFLHTSSATALVTSLAAQPVWGQCTVSGALSGGSTTKDYVDSCYIPPEVIGMGQPAEFWSTDIYTGTTVTDAFQTVGSPDRQALLCLIDTVKASGNFTVPAVPETPVSPATPAQSFNVGVALESPSTIGWYLAAIWLDAYFDFFDGVVVPGRSTSTPQDWVEHFHALYVIAEAGGFGGVAVISPVFSSGALTSWSGVLPGSGTCTV